MAFVLIDNLPADSGENDVMQLLAEQGALPPQALQMAPGLGEHVAVSCAWDDDSYAQAVAQQLHEHSWRGRILSAVFLPTAQG